MTSPNNTPRRDTPTSRSRRPHLEIQFHPGSIRWGVRYLLLSKRQVVGGSIAGLCYLVFLLFGLAMTPTVVSDVLARQRYDELELERLREGERLQGLVEELAELETKGDQLVIDVSRIHLAYGLTTEAKGTGGYPQPPPGIPRSIYRQDLEQGYRQLAGVEEHLETARIFIDEISAFETANLDQVKTTPSTSPLKREAYVMTSPFGSRRSPFTGELDFHAGIDLAANIGTPIYATADGTVTYAKQYPMKRSVAWWRYGKLVALKNGDRFMTIFAHCDEIKVKVGQEVRQGEIIATVGNSGWSTNPHLHYEVRFQDEEGEWRPKDPRIYILDQRWTNEELLLVRARQAPNPDDYEPLPPVIGR